ncbi:MAG: XdhC/CoxI family protein [Deltaproteobacteria bacterium]|nr:XdhC/CoxI family protein [Deltaproteobacteria bacterium]
MEQVVRLLNEELAAGRPAVLVTVIGRAGSAPREPGSRMAVTQSGVFAGSMGGGPAEAGALAMAARIFETNEAARIIRQDLSGPQAAEAGMICGGSIDALLEKIQGPADIALFGSLAQGLSQGQSMIAGTLLGQVDESGLCSRAERFLIVEGRPAPGSADPGAETEALVASAKKVGPGGLVRLPSGLCFVGQVREQGTVWLMGAGHVAVHVAALAKTVGFRVVVMDDRADFANTERFSTADQVLVLPDFNRCFRDHGLGRESYIVIVTRGHEYDRTVLAQALQTPARYVGMIGSRSKREAIYAALRRQGVADDVLSRVHSPIGLGIGAETPEEIAVSIVAELIQARAGKTS